MIDTVKMDSEEQSGHLAESEVARLLSVLQNAEFKRSETRNITKDHSFKPRSLMEIAVEAQQRDAEIEASNNPKKHSPWRSALRQRRQVGASGQCPEPNDPILNNQESAIDKDSDEASILC